MTDKEPVLVPDQGMLVTMALTRLAAQHPTVFTKLTALAKEIERLELGDEKLHDLLGMMAIGLNNGLMVKPSTADKKGRGNRR